MCLCRRGYDYGRDPSRETAGRFVVRKVGREESGVSGLPAADARPHWEAAPTARGLMALSSLECFCLTLWIAKASCKLSQNCSEVPKYFDKRAAISGVIPRFPRTMSLTVGAETCNSIANL